jgi:hypothetical protein
MGKAVYDCAFADLAFGLHRLGAYKNANADLPRLFDELIFRSMNYNCKLNTYF